MIVGISTFLSVVEISCNRIACGIGGGACCWGEAGCWRVTFFSLRGLLLVGAVQVLPARVKLVKKGGFGCAGRVLYGWARQANVPGEFCTGWARQANVPGEFCTGWAAELDTPGEFCTGTGPACGTKFSLLGLVVGECAKSSPSARKMAQNRRFVACWASFSRKHCSRGCAGRILSRVSL